MLFFISAGEVGKPNKTTAKKSVGFLKYYINLFTIAALAVQRYIYVCHATVAKQWCTLARSVHKVSVKSYARKKYRIIFFL
jgi:hypothetical protein